MRVLPCKLTYFYVLQGSFWSQIFEKPCPAKSNFSGVVLFLKKPLETFCKKKLTIRGKKKLTWEVTLAES